MSQMLGRKLNYWALMGASVVVIVINSVGAARDWWPGSAFAALPMLAIAYAVGWVFGRPVERSST